MPGYLRQAICFFILGAIFGLNKWNFKHECISGEKKHILGLLLAIIALLLPTNYFLTRTASVLLFFAACLLIDLLPEKAFTKIIIIYSFWIYATHGKLLSGLQIAATRLIGQNNFAVTIEYFFLPFLVLGLCIIIGMIIRRNFPHLYSVLTGAR